MKCNKCGRDTDVKDTRTLTTINDVCFVRRIRVCSKKHKTITHEVSVEHSAIPDVYRMKRVRKSTKPKKKPKPEKKDQWLKNIMSKLDS
jgi:transcriptional regulator NrdR family protein